MKRLRNILAVLALFSAMPWMVRAQTNPTLVAPPPPSAVANTPAPPPPSIVRIEQVPPIKIEQSGHSSFWDRIVPIIAPAISGLIALGGVWLGLRVGQNNTQRTIDAAQRNSDAAINQKANEAELKEIQEKLDAFYGPYLQRSEENRLLALELRDRQPDKATFRTLLKLLDPAWFPSLSNADRTIVDEIVGNGVALRVLIREKSGTVDPAVLPYLSRAAAHFTMLKLAKDGALDNDSDRFQRYVYPQQVDNVLASEMARLKRRMDLLRADPEKRPNPLEGLVIAPGLALPPWPEPARGDA